MWQSLTKYLKGSLDELKKVTWPTREEVVRYSIIVILSTLVSIGVLVAVDYGLSELVDWLVS